MFTVECPGHGARVLIWSSGVEAVRNTADGIEVDYRCMCGHRGTWHTGKHRTAHTGDPTAAAPVAGDEVEATVA